MQDSVCYNINMSHMKKDLGGGAVEHFPSSDNFLHIIDNCISDFAGKLQSNDEVTVVSMMLQISTPLSSTFNTPFQNREQGLDDVNKSVLSHAFVIL